MSEDKKTWSGDNPLFSALTGLAALVGVGVAGYLTWYHHWIDTGLGEAECDFTATINCAPVLISEFSTLPGTEISIATPGLASYLLIIGLIAFGRKNPKRRFVMPLVWSMGAFSLLVSVALLIISKVAIGYWCPYCMGLYAVNIAYFGLAWAASGRAPKVMLADVLGDTAGLGKAVAAGLAIMLPLFGAETAMHNSMIAQKTAESVGGLASSGGDNNPGQQVETRLGQTADGPIDSSDHNGQHRPLPDHIAGMSCEGESTGNNEWCVPLDASDPWKGNPEASVVVVEYVDFQCGYCKRMTNTMKELEEAYHGDVLFVFKHFPMSPNCNDGVRNNRHPQACNAARASICAQEQGRFWDYHDIAFKNQHKLGSRDLRHYAEELNLDMRAWSSCMQSQRPAQALREDTVGGTAMEITGTPRIFINGRMFRGVVPAQTLARQIEIELGRPPREAAANAAEMSGIDAMLTGVHPHDAPEMTEIRYGDLHFRMDTFEASWEEPGGAAISGPGLVPVVGASWFQAQASCEAAGKRLCSEEEWIAACQGAEPLDDDGDGEFADDYIEGWSYPYSDYYVRSACWDTGDLRENRPHYTGSSEDCRSRDDVFDLVGNLQEWAGTSEDGAVLLGGAYYNAEKSRCYRRNDTFGAGLRNQTTGFRCCQSIE